MVSQVTTNGEAPHTGEPVLELRNVSKTFGGTQALRHVDLTVLEGEVHALVGHNGSGKSTLIKILAGYHDADEGAEAWLDGEPINLGHTTDSRHERLRFVHQELGLVLELTAVENLALHGGFARTRLGRVDWSQQASGAHALLERFGVDLNVKRPLSEATPVQRTVVAIAAALQGWTGGSGVLVLDEPTAILPAGEVEQLFDIVDEVRRQGTSVIYVSHRLDEIFRLADRVTVLRGGSVVAQRDVADIDKRGLVRVMLGDAAADHEAVALTAREAAPVALEGRGLEGRYLRGADFQLREGEILGVAGRPGSGREELPYLVAGVHEFPVEGELRTPRSSPEWIHAGRAGSINTALVPAERAIEGVVGEMGVRENLTLSVLGRIATPGRLSRRRESAFAETWMERLDVKGPGPNAPINTLSGGNQQKVLIGRNLCREPEILLLCEPTAGVDIGTRQAIYALVAAQAEQGLSVLVSSSDDGDLLAMCSRILVFEEGRIVSELAGEAITEQSLVHALQEIEEER